MDDFFTWFVFNTSFFILVETTEWLIFSSPFNTSFLIIISFFKFGISILLIGTKVSRIFLSLLVFFSGNFSMKEIFPILIPFSISNFVLLCFGIIVFSSVFSFLITIDSGPFINFSCFFIKSSLLGTALEKMSIFLPIIESVSFFALILLLALEIFRSGV